MTIEPQTRVKLERSLSLHDLQSWVETDYLLGRWYLAEFNGPLRGNTSTFIQRHEAAIRRYVVASLTPADAMLRMLAL